MALSDFQTYMDISKEAHISENSKLTFTDERKHLTSVFLGLSYLTLNYCGQLYPFTCEFHIFSFSLFFK